MEYGLIGEHLGHSFSKEIHALIASYDYILKEVAKEDFDSFMRKKNFKGINVTIPYKQDVIPYLDYIDDMAKEIGAVNTIVNKDGKLYGYNTDFAGMESLIKHMGVSLYGRKVLILGSGGTSKTAYAVAKHLGAGEIYRVSRQERSDTITYHEALSFHDDANVIINATPSGMYPNNDDCPIDLDSFFDLETVIDAIYNPLRSNLVQNALKKGCVAEGGLYMLVAQAVAASSRFTGRLYSQKSTDEICGHFFKKKQNIILTGMPASGKTTIGRMLAAKNGRSFYDVDDEVVKLAEMSIPDIFEKQGEEAFRDYETQVIKKLASLNGAVISTGGGASLKEENIRYLKSNGKIFFLDRPLQHLYPTSDRPTANSKEAIAKRYQERYPQYLATADVVIKTSRNKMENVIKIERSI